MRNELTPLAQRFWNRVRKTDSCWLWMGNRKEPRRSQNAGYGRVEIHVNPVRYAYAHRVSWELHRGPVPTGKMVLHTCDNPPCVNPLHLFLGTQLDNMKDCKAKGRKAVGIRNGRSRLSPEQVQDIRACIESGESTRSIARRYGIGKSSVWAISARINWSHL